MKKFFSLIALVGVFAACQQENIRTAFSVDPAVATINLSAKCVDGTNITAKTSFTVDGTAVNGNVATISGTNLVGKTVKVAATWTGYDGQKNFTASQDVVINLLAGGKGTYQADFVLGTVTLPDDYVITQIKKSASETTTRYFLDACHSYYGYVGHNSALAHGWVSHGDAHETHDMSHGQVVYHDGYMTGGHEEIFVGGDLALYYVQNPTEFVVRGTVNYTEFSGEEAVDELVWYTNLRPGFIQKIWEELDEAEIKETPKTLDIIVSGWSAYSVFSDVTEILYDYTYTATGKNGESFKVASFSTIFKASTEANFLEWACPGHEAHYVEGHGHDSHGTAHGSSNAGGGIVYPN